jgi:hypothetical protein
VSSILPPLIGLLLAGGAAVLALWASRKLNDHRREQDLIFLQLLIPKKESKEDREHESEKFSSGQDFKEVVGVMDHLFQSLYALHNSKPSRHWRGQPFFSVEYAALDGDILFFIVCPRNAVHLVEKQITSFYPDAVIDQVEDYNIFTEHSVVASTILLPKQN